jgi:hypothetical protein
MRKGNYRPLKKMKKKEFIDLLQAKGFLKLSICFKLKKWKKVKREMKEYHKEFLNCTIS